MKRVTGITAFIMALVLVAGMLMVSVGAEKSPEEIEAEMRAEEARREIIKKDAGTISLTVGDQNNLKSWMMFENDNEDVELSVVGDFTWSSSKPAVASVDANGVVTANRVGSSTITVAYKDNRANTVQQTVSVKVVSVDQESVDFYFTLDEGKKISLQEILYPDYKGDGSYGKVSWNSQNTNVATIESDGMLTANRHGTSTITTTHTGTNGESTSQKVTVKVVSNQTSNPFNSITVTMNAGDTVDFVKMFYPGYTGASTFGEVTCSTSDASIASVESGHVVTAKSSGSCTVTIERAGSNNDTFRQAITVKVAG